MRQSFFVKIKSCQLTNKTQHIILNYFVEGIEGNITSLPKNYSISFIISALNNNGIHGTMYKWGNVMKKMHPNTTSQREEFMKIDTVVNYLGYWSDNGCYFDGGNPLNTTIAKILFDNFSINKIPVRYLQLDPYWYEDALWIPNKNLFPNGLSDLYKQIGNISLLLYSSNWKQNYTEIYYNENYDLNLSLFAQTIDIDRSPMAEPVGYGDSYTFYSFIISQYSNISIGFEIDFMDYEYAGFSIFTNGYNNMVNMSYQWMKGINDANIKYNQSIQYCMTPPLYVLDALNFGHVTNVRASEDDLPSDLFRWKIAYSNLLLSSLSIRPFFDSLWTTSIQEPNQYDNFIYFDTEMNSIISLLGNGPFGIGDNINKTNITIINRICRIDGLLLHPSISITPIDISFFKKPDNITINDSYHTKPFYRPYEGEIWFTYTKLLNNNNNITSYIIFAIDIWKEKYKLNFNDLYPYPNKNEKFIVYQFDDSNVNEYGPCKNNTIYTQCGNGSLLYIFDNNNSLNIQTNLPPILNPTHLHSWNLYNIFKIQSNGWALLGDMTKYVSVSDKRFIDLQIINKNEGGGLKVIIKGAPNEQIIVCFLNNKNKIIQIKVNFNKNGDQQTLIVN